ncbi:MAG TPA: hypothetical protein VK714_00685 [Myxococcota bacterium]|nr:hypothetical protein [Myxococcota bacterium]
MGGPPISVAAAARRLGRSVHAVRRFILAGRLEAFNVGAGSTPR